ncbi:MAG: hypothetical protein CMQ41_12110 [Gammaproteobacteria bacterium]|nr:hypothetical protein [Gammaproteobacteria bacterium]|tara:strand:- start:300 stop:1037 length:738 start_codon:yes stop_codon:yes gene_type:complete
MVVTENGNYRFVKKALTFVFTLFIPFLSFSQDDRFQAGVAAEERGHFATALRSWIPLAEEGVPEAQNNVGHMYEKGQGVAQNYSVAMQWYRRAAESELAEAQLNIGLLYYYGYGVATNHREAVSWFRLAAENELPEAEYMLALSYEQGTGISLDYREARRLFLKSARANYAPAQMMYSFMLQAGEGLEDSDPFRAYIWGKIAEQNGSEEALDVTSISSILLEDEEVAEADLIIERCLTQGLDTCP